MYPITTVPEESTPRAPAREVVSGVPEQITNGMDLEGMEPIVGILFQRTHKVQFEIQ